MVLRLVHLERVTNVATILGRRVFQPILHLLQHIEEPDRDCQKHIVDKTIKADLKQR